MTIPTAEEVRRLFLYDPETGSLTWCVKAASRVCIGDEAGSFNGGYRVVSINHKTHKAHRLIWLMVHGEWPPMVDHINGNRADNRLVNLRPADSNLNAQNQRRPQKNNKCGYMGVSAYRNRWKAQISDAGEVIYLGLYDTPESAHAAYVTAKRRLHAGCVL